MIKPTNGRIVLFTPSTDNLLSQKYLQFDATVPLSAMVVHVWNDRLINVVVFDSVGLPRSAISVPLLQDDDRKPEGGYFCSWMEYQKGQAAKADAAEAKTSVGFVDARGHAMTAEQMDAQMGHQGRLAPRP